MPPRSEPWRGRKPRRAPLKPAGASKRCLEFSRGRRPRPRSASYESGSFQVIPATPAAGGTGDASPTNIASSPSAKWAEARDRRDRSRGGRLFGRGHGKRRAGGIVALHAGWPFVISALPPRGGSPASRPQSLFSREGPDAAPSIPRWGTRRPDNSRWKTPRASSERPRPRESCERCCAAPLDRMGPPILKTRTVLVHAARRPSASVDGADLGRGPLQDRGLGRPFFLHERSEPRSAEPSLETALCFAGVC